MTPEHEHHLKGVIAKAQDGDAEAIGFLRKVVHFTSESAPPEWIINFCKMILDWESGSN